MPFNYHMLWDNSGFAGEGDDYECNCECECEEEKPRRHRMRREYHVYYHGKED